MNLEYIGKLVNTHGLKGEVRIISDFKYKFDVFKKGNNIYIKDTKYIISSYRKHKIFDMVTLENIDSIEQSEVLKGSNVYIKRSDYKFNGYLDSDLIGLLAYDNDKYTGTIIDIYKTVKDEILVIDGIKRHMVPYIPEFIKDIDLKNKRIDINYIEGLYDKD